MRVGDHLTIPDLVSDVIISKTQTSGVTKKEIRWFYLTTAFKYSMCLMLGIDLVLLFRLHAQSWVVFISLLVCNIVQIYCLKSVIDNTHNAKQHVMHLMMKVCTTYTLSSGVMIHINFKKRDEFYGLVYDRSGEVVDALFNSNTLDRAVHGSVTKTITILSS